VLVSLWLFSPTQAQDVFLKEDIMEVEMGHNEKPKGPSQVNPAADSFIPSCLQDAAELQMICRAAAAADDGLSCFL